LRTTAATTSKGRSGIHLYTLLLSVTTKDAKKLGG
jgi:hypothetical protein